MRASSTTGPVGGCCAMAHRTAGARSCAWPRSWWSPSPSPRGAWPTSARPPATSDTEDATGTDVRHRSSLGHTAGGSAWLVDTAEQQVGDVVDEPVELGA